MKKNKIDGPYSTPIILPEQEVLNEWLDYNGHMNVAYYTLAFDKSLDIFLEDLLGIGESHAYKNNQGPFVVQAHYHYLNEMRLNEKFHVRLFVVDCDKNKMHLCMEIYSLFQEKVIAVVEQVLINVNLKLRKSEPYPPWAFEKLIKLKNTHKNASLPSAFGKSIGLKK